MFEKFSVRSKPHFIISPDDKKKFIFWTEIYDKIDQICQDKKNEFRKKGFNYIDIDQQVTAFNSMFNSHIIFLSTLLQAEYMSYLPDGTVTGLEKVFYELKKLGFETNSNKNNQKPPRGSKMIKVFISYNRNDSKFALKLKEALEAKNIGVTIDVESLQFSGDIIEFINKSVEESDFTISIISENSLKSVWVIDEALNTLIHEGVTHEKKFMPIYIDNSFLDNKFSLEVIKKINTDINEILQITQEFIKEGAGTEHLDPQRERLNNAKSNLPKLLKKLHETNVADFTDEKFNENLPKLIDVIEEVKK